MTKYIDASNMVLGRMSSIVAKMLLEGEEVVIINAERTSIVGKKQMIYARYRFKRELGNSRKGPFFPRMPDRIVKRSVRGMLPKNTKGRMALKMLKVYIGTPPELRKVKPEKIDAEVRGIEGTTYISVGDVARHMGARF